MLSPSVIESGKEYPLVLFLHGSGERGDDNEKQLLHGGAVFSNPANSDKYPAFVVFPQCKERAWTDRMAPPRIYARCPRPSGIKIGRARDGAG